MGTSVNAACQGNRSMCHFGHACHRFVSSALDCNDFFYRTGSCKASNGTWWWETARWSVRYLQVTMGGKGHGLTDLHNQSYRPLTALPTQPVAAPRLMNQSKRLRPQWPATNCGIHGSTQSPLNPSAVYVTWHQNTSVFRTLLFAHGLLANSTEQETFLRS